MFDRLRGKFYDKQVLEIIEQELVSLLGKKRGEECTGMFAMAILKAQEFDRLPTDMLSTFRKEGLSVREAAMAYLDASVTAIKRVLHKAGRSSADIDAVISGMESAIDHLFLTGPSMRILPRNGSAGENLADFGEDWKPRKS